MEGRVVMTDFNSLKDISWPAAFLGAVVVIAAAAVIIAWIRALLGK